MGITDNRIIHNNLVLQFSPDRTEAMLTIEERAYAPYPGHDYVADFLRKNNITDTLLENELKGMLEQKIYNTPVCIARGKECRPSKNGEIRYLFTDHSNRPAPGPEENVNHRERSPIKTVSRGEPVARVIPPVPGEDGFTVTGEIIPAGIPVEKKLPSGRNIAPDPADNNLLIAQANGSVNVMSETRIDIDPVLNIQGNVDYSTGNLDFTGSIIVNGDIISGFTVKVTGTIQVKGVIEDAVVYAGGDIYAAGCAGGEKGSISAGGNIFIKYAENSRISAGMDIYVEEYLMNSDVHADGNIYVTKKNGMITGGETSAFHAVEANTIGNIDEIKTVVSVGFSSELKQQFVLIDREQTRNINNLGDINNALKKLNRFIMIKKQLPGKMKTQIEVLLKMKDAVEEKISVLLDRHVEVIKKLSQTETATVRVYNNFYPGVLINFPDKQMINKETKSHVALRLQDDVIIITPLLKEKK
jgi:uncharacterized protein (DUF342 family)